MAKNKMTGCRVCGAEIAKSAKSCPHCGAKNKKPIFKRWWFWIIIIFLLGTIGNSRKHVKRKDIPSSSTSQSISYAGTDKSATTIATEAARVEPELIETEPEVIQTEPPVTDETLPTNTDGGIDPDFKAAMDAYESFYVEYCEFMKKYMANPADLSLLTKYVDMLSKAEQINQAFESWNEDDLNNEELKYYLDVNNRVMQMMIDIGG